MSGRTSLGLFLVLLGGLFLLDQTGLANFGHVVGSWWPAILILLGVSQWARSPGRRTGPLVMTVIGIVFLLDTLDIISVWNLLWPLAIIGVGVWLILNRGSAPHVNDADTVNLSAAFAGVESVSRSQNFRGGSLSAFFGGVGLDLRDAAVAPGGARLDVTTFCGGAEITVPPTWRVIIEGTPLFGGLENSAAGAGALPDQAPELIVMGTIFFGGVEINNKT
ncbi:MAG: LiaI-LiaF-like domain-containing protein [Acidobacteriota bacterium]